MASNSTREFAFYNLKFSAHGGKYRSLPPHPINKHLEWLVEAYNENVRYLFSNKKKLYYIQNLEETESYIFLLVKYVDGSARDHTLEDFDTNETTVIAKTDRQGESYTSHIYISKSVTNNGFKMIVEVGNGFTIGCLSVMFSGILKEYLSKHPIFVIVPDPSGAHKDHKEVTLKKWPDVLARGTLADDFAADINNSNITDVELISYNDEQVNLEGTRLHVTKAIVKLKVENSGLLASGVETMRKLAGLNCRKFQEIAITYKQHDAKAIRARLECDEQLNPIDVDRLIKKIVIENWAATIKQAYNEIQAEVKAAMLRHKDD